MNKYRENNPSFKASSKVGLILLKAFKKEICRTILLSLSSDVSIIINLYMTSFFIRWLRDEDSPQYLGYIYAIVLSLLTLVSGWTRNYYLFEASCTGVNIRKGVSGLLFSKILRCTQKSNAKASSGKFVSLVSGELQFVERGFLILPSVVSSPITLLFTLIMLSFIFKEAVLFGLLVALLIIALEVVASKMINRYKYREGSFSDKRLKTISDIINGIRTIKAYAWEIPFLNLVNKFRSKMLLNSAKNQLIESSMWGITG